MTEAAITSLFGKKNKIIGCFELKLCKTRSIRFDTVKPHQLKALLAVSGEEGLFHKINDAPIYSGMKTRFTNQKPFDCFFFTEVPAFIVVCFYIPRQQKKCYYIEPEIWQDLRKNNSKKSIRQEELALYASNIIDLNDQTKIPSRQGSSKVGKAEKRR